MSWFTEDQVQPFKKLIRNTLYRAISFPDYPHIILQGREGDQGYDLPDDIIDRYGWLIRSSTPTVNYDYSTESDAYGWAFVGNAISEELKEVFSLTGLENVFVASWGSMKLSQCLDRNGSPIDYGRAAVHVLETDFQLDFVPRIESPDWDLFERGIVSYVTILNLRLGEY